MMRALHLGGLTVAAFAAAFVLAWAAFSYSSADMQILLDVLALCF